uniref:Uncharacterized protein n=1 Tax=Moniliophthora roreri TaxID=221103 RepID=A0A0W0G598_MONRR
MDIIFILLDILLTRSLASS